jgi:uncharacterized protein (TIGR03086 family)
MSPAPPARLPSMETTTLDLAPQAAEVARLAAGVRDDQLDGPTPCPDMSVATLLDHLVGLTLAFRLAAEKVPQTSPPTASADQLPADWRERLPAQLDDLVAAWREPAAWQGTTVAGGVEAPAPVMATVALDELVVHGWDLAVATGQGYRPDGTSVRACFEFIGDRSDEPADANSGLFGPQVPVPEDAPLLDRLVGRAGRDPAWRP